MLLLLVHLLLVSTDETPPCSIPFANWRVDLNGAINSDCPSNLWPATGAKERGRLGVRVHNDPPHTSVRSLFSGRRQLPASKVREIH